MSTFNKTAVVIYHRNILTKYDPKWTYNCIDKIKKQTNQNFSVIELNFGGDDSVVYDGDRPHFFYSEKIDNLGEAITRAFDICFKELKFDLAFNINLDDDYEIDRFELQINCQEITGADVVTSNFYVTNSELGLEGSSLTQFCIGIDDIETQNKIIDIEFSRNHNIIGFPVCLFTKNFWIGNEGLPLAEESKGREDFDLWISARKKGYKFYIIEKPLFKYRIHNTNISKRLSDL